MSLLIINGVRHQGPRHFGIEITETVAFQAQSDWVIRQRKDDQWGRITRNGMDLRWQVNGI